MTLLVAERPFVAYGPSHWALMVLIAGGSVLIGLFGHRTRDAPAARRFARLFSQFAVVWHHTHRFEVSALHPQVPERSPPTQPVDAAKRG